LRLCTKEFTCLALFTPDLELFDIDRFEVLRGPQGTLFGAGSEAGTLRYITNQPKLGVFEGTTDASVELPRDSTVGGSARAALNIPLGDTTAVRFVLRATRWAGIKPALAPCSNAEFPRR
jgi:iron complex outermembrane recepter protein